MKLILPPGVALLWISQSSGFSHKTATQIRIPVQPPFPDGVCGGKVVSIPPRDTYGIDTKLSGNQILLPPRAIDVWLPPDYSPSSATKHPILFCHDGQNAMSDAASWTGASWRMIGALTQLAGRQLLRTATPIVVMVPSADGDLVPGIRRRHLEYASEGLFADAHADFIARTVKPLIQSRFQGASEDEVYVIGSSLGGQASLQLLLRFPDEFQGAACLSPCFQPSTLASVKRNASLLKSKRIYMDIGGDMGDEKVPVFELLDHLTAEHWWNPGYWWLDSQLQPGVEAMKREMDLAGIDYLFHEEPGGRHNERAWSKRIDLPLLHFFGR